MRENGHEPQDEGPAAERSGAATRYQLRQQLVSFGDDYTVENDRGEQVYKVDGKAFHIGKKLVIEDMQGHELCTIKGRLLHIRDTMDITGPNGETLATIKKALITLLWGQWDVEVSAGPDMDVRGEVLNHEYTLESGGQKVATVSKQWFRIADSYGVEIAPGQNDLLILAVIVAVDMMAHPR
jgi:uncharacterized protein YxjI